MRVVIDLQGGQTESRRRGIGRYSVALATAIARTERRHEVWICLSDSFPGTVDAIREAFSGVLPPERIVVFGVPRQVAACDPRNDWRREAGERIRESFLADLQPDVVFVSSLFEGAWDDAVLSVGKLRGGPLTAVTLYDLIPLLNSDTYLSDRHVRRWYHKKLDSLRRADLLLAISDYSRQEAISHGGVDADGVVSISSACSEVFQPVQLDELSATALRDHYGIRLPFLMYSGALELRKNLDRLIEAFSLLPSDLLSSHQLVFVGDVSAADQIRIEQLAQTLGVRDRLVLTGHVPDDDLIRLFNCCALFVFPSLHEGFGLPALEAMACGAPTIGSNATSVPEVIGREDALFNPSSAGSISDKIRQVLEDESFRQELRRHGLRQARKFSWETSARRAIDALEALFRKRGSRTAQAWSDLMRQRADRYRELISSIAAIAHDVGSPTEDDLAEVANCIAANQRLADRITRSSDLPARLAWRLEGPFDTSYSLSIVNRQTANALSSQGHLVALHSTEGPGDFDPDPHFLRANPAVAQLHARAAALTASDADVCSRNLYPPRVGDMDGRLNVMHGYAWEETGFPSDWAEAFNDHLQGLACVSEHVEKLLIDNGVEVPIAVTGNGVDHWEAVQPAPDTTIEAKSFRFLHVSSCFPRKGADALLKAYGIAFRDSDDVSLVIKTFPNPHNQIHQWLQEAREADSGFPHVVIMEADLADEELKRLYMQCHALVAPSRAEGFGLPLAEAMLTGLAVITTGWSGQLEFCSDETAWLVDYTFEPAKSHFQLFDSVWAEPDVQHLAQTLKAVHSLPAEERARRAARGRELLLGNYRWEHVAERLVTAVRAWSRCQEQTELRIGWVTTFNIKCGIATYSEHLLEHFSERVTVLAAKSQQLTRADGPEVVRCWESGAGDELRQLRQVIVQQGIDVVVVQFNYFFFDFAQLASFLVDQHNGGRAVIVVLHSTQDPIHVDANRQLRRLLPQFKRCDRILVHTVADLNRLKQLGLMDNVALFPHGILEGPRSDSSMAESRGPDHVFTVATYGFFLPHKGLLETIDAIAVLRKWGMRVRLLMVNAEYPVGESAAAIAEARARIAACGLEGDVELITEFLADEASVLLLSRADLILFPYQATGESASGAVRYGIATGVPVAVTPVEIFGDVAEITYRLPGTSADAIADGIRALAREIRSDSDVLKAKRAEIDRWRDTHSYRRLAYRLEAMLTALARRNRVRRDVTSASLGSSMDSNLDQHDASPSSSAPGGNLVAA